MLHRAHSATISYRTRHCGAALATMACLAALPMALAQEPGPGHVPYSTALPPGQVGAYRLTRGGPIRGYFQPVEIRAPEGTEIALAVDGAFAEPQAAPVRVGMLIAPIYRLRVTGIPRRDGEEVFPTIEIIDRLYAPFGQHRKFPIPIELTEEELHLALAGKFVTRVIYVEDPNSAVPRDEGDSQMLYDAGPGANPVDVADRLGRPVAILRMGGIAPDPFDGPDMDFLAGCPPFTVFRPYLNVEDRREGASATRQEHSDDVAHLAEADAENAELDDANSGESSIVSDEVER